ncbi:MAG: MMPL family transporter, partial [Candidatus Margulisbacteria bacterium]|nr:MMPL family transporter [Candidatus Margulisiibacteriota bacterium]
MENIVKFLMRRPLATIVVILALTAVMGVACTTLRMETDIKKLLPNDSASVTAYNEIDEKFGGADQLFIIVEDKNIFDAPTLAKIRELTEKLKTISGVSRTISITNLDEIKAVPGGIEIAPLDYSDLAKFRQKLLSDDKYAGVFVSKDGSATLILIKLFIARDDKTVPAVRALIKNFAQPEKIYLTGPPYISQVIQEGMAQDLIRLIPLALALVSFILYLSFRNWYGIVLPLATVVISAIWSMGLMSLLGKPITVLSCAVPVLLISVGSAYGIHIISRFQEEDSGVSPKAALEKTMSKTGIAIFIAAATTVVGYLSNVVSDISAIQTFGYITGFGVTIAFIVSMTFIPAVLQFVRKKNNGIKAVADHDPLSRSLSLLGKVVTVKKFWVFAVTAALLIIAAIGYPRLTTETDPVKYFSQKSEVVKTTELVKKKFGGAITIDIMFKGDLKDPETLSKIEQLQARMRSIELLGPSYSIADALKETNCYMNDNRQEFKVIPKSRDGIAQYLLLLSMTGSDLVENMITSDHESALLSVRVGTSKSSVIDRIVKQLKQEITDIFGADHQVEIKLSGMAVILKEMREMLIANQAQSLALALIFTFIMIWALYRTFWGALFCMTPIFVTVCLNFGVMSWFGIPLDMATVLVGSVAVGMGIDYSVHLFNRYKEERAAGKRADTSVILSLNTVGKAIIYNAASVAVGFVILIFSEFEILKSFGILVALTMGFAAFGALALLPE